MLRPPPRPFLGARPGKPGAEADAVLVGYATDGGVSFRAGAAAAPAALRAFSESIETYSPRAGRDLEDLVLLDVGDVTAREEIEDEVARIAGAGPRSFLVGMGGDHSVTPPAAGGVARAHPGLAVVGFDAHLDLREDYPGDHACTYRRLAEDGIDCYVFGVRSGARSEWQDAPAVLAAWSRELAVPSEVRRHLEGRPVYVTIDIDVLDPSVAPGTGNPEAGGATFVELLEAVESLAGLRVVAADIVEVSPPLDPSGITLGAAALLVRELVLRFA